MHLHRSAKAIPFALTDVRFAGKTAARHRGASPTGSGLLQKKLTRSDSSVLTLHDEELDALAAGQSSHDGGQICCRQSSHHAQTQARDWSMSAE